MAANVQKVVDLGGDVLEVTGTVDGIDDDNGNPAVFVARGWVSAMTNHYDESANDEDGNRLPDARPREMTDDEKHAYWSSLLTNAAPAPAPAPTTVLFEAPVTDAGGS